jgi:AcrR family transcriptional regulator
MMNEHTDVRTSIRQERRDAIKNRQQILSAARELFATQGVDNTSMEEIGRAAGVGKGTLYRRFAHKGELCEALLEDDLTVFCTRVDTAMAESDTSQTALSRLEWLFTQYIAMVELHIPLLAAIQEAAAGTRRHSFYQSPFYTWLHAHIVGLLTTAVAQGEAVDLDVVFTADTILAAVTPPLYGFQQQHRGFSRERIVVGMRRLFIDGLRGQVADQ